MSTSSEYSGSIPPDATAAALGWAGFKGLFLFGGKSHVGDKCGETGLVGGSEGLTLGVLRGADGAVALQGHRVVVEGGDVGLAARQAHRHVTHLAVRAHAVVPVDVGRVRHGFLQGPHTHTHTRDLRICW